MLLIRRVMGFAVVGVVLAVLPACGDSSGGTVSDSNSASGGSTTGATDATMGATEPTSSGSMSGSTTGEEGGNSDSLSGTTGDEGGNSDSLSGTVSSGVESDSMSGSGGTTTGMTGTSGGESTGEVETSATSTGEPIDCADLGNEAECVAAGCMAIKGRLFFDDGADLCLEAPSFLACAEQAACAEVITTVCKGAVQYQLPNACVPAGYMICDAPFDPDMMFDECQ